MVKLEFSYAVSRVCAGEASEQFGLVILLVVNINRLSVAVNELDHLLLPDQLHIYDFSIIAVGRPLLHLLEF